MATSLFLSWAYWKTKDIGVRYGRHLTSRTRHGPQGPPCEKFGWGEYALTGSVPCECTFGATKLLTWGGVRAAPSTRRPPLTPAGLGKPHGDPEVYPGPHVAFGLGSKAHSGIQITRSPEEVSPRRPATPFPTGIIQPCVPRATGAICWANPGNSRIQGWGAVVLESFSCSCVGVN